MSIWGKITVIRNKITIENEAKLNPNRSINVPAIIGPIKAPNPQTEVKRPETIPWVLRSFGYPFEL
jgi:hypothetical protein